MATGRHYTQDQVDSLYEYCSKRYYYSGGHLHRNSNHTTVSASKKGYRTISIEVEGFPQQMGLHRIVYLLNHRSLPLIVDHIDRDHTNNDISNLRAASSGLNMYNREMTPLNTTGFTGIYLNKRVNCERYVARFQHKHLGSFPTAEEAHAAYCAAAQVVYGVNHNGS